MSAFIKVLILIEPSIPSDVYTGWLTFIFYGCWWFIFIFIFLVRSHKMIHKNWKFMFDKNETSQKHLLQRCRYSLISK